ncbi:beta-propeller domain-containing protein [Nocardioides lijunqiniae]|uniref:beta-propeller domain-containing protein n=1 Tax=Nocardioides lijunqiniae TaxID=2760832 RepID=UPI0018785A51|nr:beta-propeller domain-containing protein [Nocardioides lijunqiniae]
MSDLERLWDEIPVGPAPVAAIVRRGAAGRPPERRRRVVRPLVRAAVVGSVAAAFVVGVMVGQPTDDGAGPGAGPLPAQPPPIAPAAFHGDLQAAASCDALLDHYVERALELVGPHGWDTYGSYEQNARMTRDLDAVAGPTSSEAEAYGSVSSDTGTNVQEAGVDEPDHVKTDGELLVRVRDAELSTYDVSGDAVAELGSLDLGDLRDAEILLAGDTVVAVGTIGRLASPGTRVVTVDVADPVSPTVVETVDYDSALLSARQHGGDVRLVLSAGLPSLDFVQPRRRGGTWRERNRAALRANRAVVRETTLVDWVPQVTTAAGREQLVACGDVAIPRAELALDTTAVVGFSAASPTELSTLGLAASAPVAYESADHLYLATQADPWGCCWDTVSRTRTTGSTGVTHVFDFALDGAGASYVGSGEVEGALADRWSVDEHDGVLRLAVGPTQETGDFSSIVTLEAQDDELVEVGRLDHVGDDETIQSVRWFDELAFVVTFRQVDPLYAIDLSDQTAPRLGGELKIPGFSDYLHPLGPHRLVGMGQGPGAGGRWGAQVSAFEISDLEAPRRTDVHAYAVGTTALAGQDPRQFTWLPRERVALTVIQRGDTGYVSVLTFDRGRIAERLVEVEHGRDVSAVRLVPLPGDRVALVTGEDVEMFPL